MSTGPARRTGSVAAFDEDVGLGEVVADGGAGSYRFHCTQIADGSRVIAVGTRVSFLTAPGRDGRWEAADLQSA